MKQRSRLSLFGMVLSRLNFLRILNKDAKNINKCSEDVTRATIYRNTGRQSREKPLYFPWIFPYFNAYGSGFAMEWIGLFSRISNCVG
jgi:hypothetical protein